jgi:hypothetical protein
MRLSNVNGLPAEWVSVREALGLQRGRFIDEQDTDHGAVPAPSGYGHRVSVLLADEA